MKPISNRLNRALALPGWQGSAILLLLAAVSIATMAAIPSSFAAGCAWAISPWASSLLLEKARG